VAFSEAAEEVGGDYYDLIELERDQFGLIIGDVSGKGTSAAFHMAQMKGIFHTLALKDCNTDEFVKRANRALSGCLEKKSFITAIYFRINAVEQQLEFSRAGHVPALLYKQRSKEVESLEDRGMGLGILRNPDYDKFVGKKTLPYESGDVLLLHTDGIIEAKNKNQELFGLDRLKKSLTRFAHKKPTEIKEGIIQDLSDFLEGYSLDDDYTLVILKFN
jgi:serine phosphatase RsbU (regulator of sigma subunit)